ncbi:MAG: TolC family protein [Verrucomicrobiae bacterium]|nr:TolC family protein [Verrucomicrobiae bacterium]NNJ42417.1 TolC family protein [Akkermansiaceae bacterium]
MKRLNRPSVPVHTATLFFSLLFLGLGSPTTRAAEALVISLDSIPDRIRKQNPDLAAAQYRITEAQGRLHQAGRLSNPELGVHITHNPNFREHSLNMSIAQKFPVTQRLRLEKNVSQTLLKAAKAEVRNKERQLVATSKQLLIKVLAIRKQQQLLKKQEDVAQQLAHYISQAAKKGEGSVLDAGQAQLDAAQLTNQIRHLNAEAASITGQLKPLLGMSTSDHLVINGNLPKIQPPARSTNPSKRPDLHAAQLNAKAATEAAQLERAKSRDDIELSLSAGIERTDDAPVGYDTEGMFGIGFRIPLPLWNKNEGAVQEADARQARKHQEVAALSHHIQHEAATAHAEMTEWAKISHKISNTLLPLAQQQADLSAQAYRDGQGDIQTTLRTREQLLKLSSAQLNALRDFHLAKTRYEAALAK